MSQNYADLLKAQLAKMQQVQATAKAAASSLSLDTSLVPVTSTPIAPAQPPQPVAPTPGQSPTSTPATGDVVQDTASSRWHPS